jgi:tetratricopeptide (TPR) repeat protein
VAALPGEPQGANAVEVLALFADARQRQIAKAIREKKEWPPQWLSDVHAAHSILARHPLGTDYQAAGHYDFLRQLGAAAQAAKVLDAGLDRFPDSWILHDRLRSRVLAEKGAPGLEPAYGALMAVKGATPALEWYAGYAALVAAEFHRRAGAAVKAVEAYDRAIAHYELAIGANPSTRETADHYVALALAGKAKLAYERGDDEAAVADLLASFARKPEAAASLDGLNLSPVDTAKLVRVRLTERKNEELLKRLQAGLDALDPSMLLLPAYEAEVPPEGRVDSRPASRPGRRNRR